MKRVLPGLLCVLVMACDGIPPSPSSPTTTQAPVVVTPTQISMVASPGELPIGGGTARIYLETGAGSRPAPGVALDVVATGGSLNVSSVVTDSTGHAYVEWTGTKTATISASAGSLAQSMVMKVLEPATFPPAPPR